MQESMNTTTNPSASQWSVTWNWVASHRLWSFLLIAIGSASSVIYPHPPLVAFGAIAGTTLTPKRALGAATAIWLVNQVYGYGLRQYPQTTEALLWGLVMGLGTLLVTAMAAIRPTLSKMTLDLLPRLEARGIRGSSRDCKLSLSNISYPHG
jgi:hypothetical protein